MIGGISVARRYGNWETTFLRQEAIGMKVGSERFVELRMPFGRKPAHGPRAEGAGNQRQHQDRRRDVWPGHRRGGIFLVRERVSRT